MAEFHESAPSHEAAKRPAALSFAGLMQREHPPPAAEAPRLPAEVLEAWPLAQPFHLLLIDQDPAAAARFEDLARRSGWPLHWERATTLDQATSWLGEQSFHAVVLAVRGADLPTVVEPLRASTPADPLLAVVQESTSLLWPRARACGVDELLGLATLDPLGLLAALARASERRDLLRQAALNRRQDVSSRDDQLHEAQRHLARLRGLCGTTGEGVPTHRLGAYRELLRLLERTEALADPDGSAEHLLPLGLGSGDTVAAHCQAADELLRSGRIRAPRPWLLKADATLIALLVALHASPQPADRAA